MRIIHALPLAAAIALAGCGGGTEDDATEQAAAAAATVVKPLPGQYSTTLELVEFDVPGLSDNMKSMAQQAAASGFAEGNSFCLTPEQAEEGSQRMVRELAENDCTYNKFDVSGGAIDADLTCTADDGSQGKVTMTGTMTPESSDMVMVMDHQVPGMGKAHMKVNVKSQRIGDCS